MLTEDVFVCGHTVDGDSCSDSDAPLCRGFDVSDSLRPCFQCEVHGLSQSSCVLMS